MSNWGTKIISLWVCFIFDVNVENGDKSFSNHFSYLSAALSMEVEIKPDDLHSFNLEVDGLITVGDLKAIIEDIQAIPADEFYLKFDDSELEDSKKLSFYGIKHLDVIKMHGYKQ